MDWVYVDDVIDAFLRAAPGPGWRAARWTSGRGASPPPAIVVLRLRELVGGDVDPAFGAIPDRALERVRAAEPGVAAEAMGWRPRTPLEDGLPRTVAYYRSRLDGLPPLAQPGAASKPGT